MSDFLFGSICLSNIPKELIKKVKCNDGKERYYLNVSVSKMKEPREFDGRTYTHYISCAPKKDERKEGVSYYIGDLQTYVPASQSPTAEQIAAAPGMSEQGYNDLPF